MTDKDLAKLDEIKDLLWQHGCLYSKELDEDDWVLSKGFDVCIGLLRWDYKFFVELNLSTGRFLVHTVIRTSDEFYFDIENVLKQKIIEICKRSED